MRKQADLSSSDKSYLDQLVVAKTGVSASEADKLVSETFTTAKEAGEAARKARSLFALGVRSTSNRSVLRQFCCNYWRKATGSRCNNLAHN
jgi:hypothetical protein